VAAELVSRGMVADIAHHTGKAASDGLPQPHAHVMLTLRGIDPEGFAGNPPRTVISEHAEHETGTSGIRVTSVTRQHRLSDFQSAAATRSRLRSTASGALRGVGRVCAKRRQKVLLDGELLVEERAARGRVFGLGFFEVEEARIDCMRVQHQQGRVAAVDPCAVHALAPQRRVDRRAKLHESFAGVRPSGHDPASAPRLPTDIVLLGGEADRFRESWCMAGDSARDEPCGRK
jgi:hypothetical protein